MADIDLRLTDLAHGGGCGCKLPPSVLSALLAGMPAMPPCAALLVGTETGDDAAVYRLSPTQALVATTDFFTPIVDDPTDFGRIAATNALSDIYAMGATPILALAIVGMPLGKLPLETVQRILAGGAEICQAAGIPIAGGHSIDSAEPIYGLVALGLVHPDRIMRNSAAQPGDSLILTKALGIGVFSAALKRGILDPAAYRTMLASATQLNAIGPALAALPGVHAITDVTGFGLLGHTLEMTRAASLGAHLHLSAIPILPGAAPLAQAGIGTGAATRNWASYGPEVQGDPPDWQRALLCDPQTSGGLLIAAAPSATTAILAMLHEAGFPGAAQIGEMRPGTGIELAQ